MKAQAVGILLIIVVSASFLLSIGGQKSSVDEISVEEVRDKIEGKEDIILIDVRTLAEFDGPLGHLPGALLIPLAELESRLKELEIYQQKEVVVYCTSGIRSAKATAILRDKDFNAVNMVGGIIAWNKMEDLPKKDTSEVLIEAVPE